MFMNFFTSPLEQFQVLSAIFLYMEFIMPLVIQVILYFLTKYWVIGNRKLSYI